MTWRWVLCASAAVVLSTCAPLLWRSLTTPAHQHFVGNWEYVHDHSTYLMWGAQVAQGKLLVRDLHTCEPHPALLPSLPWLLVGLFSRVSLLPLLWAYHALRLLWGLSYLLLAWGVVREYFGPCARQPAGQPPPTAAPATPQGRRKGPGAITAFVWIAVGSGLKVWTDLLNHLAGRRVASSADWMPEAWGYHSLAVMPHFALALALLAGLVWVLLVSYRRPSVPLLAAAPILLGLLTWVHPFDLAVLGPLLLAHFVACRLWARPRCWAWANLAALPGAIPPLLLFWWQVRTNPVLAAWAAQNVLPSPHPLSYLTAFGVVLGLALLGLLVLRGRPALTSADWLIVLWPAITAVMINAGPVLSFERRCLEGAHIPLALLAGVGVAEALLPWLQRRWRLRRERAWRLVLAGLLVCALPTNIKLLGDGFVSTQAVIPADWVRAYRWLAAYTDPDQCVLASPQIGLHLAWMAQRPVYVGHAQQTIDFARKAAQVQEFFRPSTPAARRAELLHQSGCVWVVAWDEERAAVADLPDLQQRYATGTVSIYRRATPDPR